MPRLCSIARGPIWSDFEAARRSSILLHAAVPCLAPAFTSKGHIGRHYRAVSANGHVLLLTPCEASEMHDAIVRLRVSVWHRSRGGRDRDVPWGIILCPLFHCAGFADGPRLLFAKLDSSRVEHAALSIDLGAGSFVNFISAT